jgi:hypothetical protein
MITIIRIVIPAWIAGQIRRERICIDPIGVQGRKPCMNPDSMDGFSLPALALDTRFPAGMAGLRII